MSNPFGAFDSASNSQSIHSATAGKTAIATRISPQVVNTLASFIQNKLDLEPQVKAYRTLWECAWMNRAAELTVFLKSDGDEPYLQVIYLEQPINPPAERLQPAEISQLCQQLEAQIGLPTRASI